MRARTLEMPRFLSEHVHRYSSAAVKLTGMAA